MDSIYFKKKLPDNVILFRLPYDQIVPEKREHVKTIYELYEDRGFTLIDVNNYLKKF